MHIFIDDKLLGGASPLDQFENFSLLSEKYSFFGITFTNTSLFLILSCIIIGFFFCFLHIKNYFYCKGGEAHLKKQLVLFVARIVPTRWQFFIEQIYITVLNLIKDNVNKKGYVFFPFIKTLFIFLLAINLVGMVPYSFTVTSHIIVTLSLALAIFLGINIIGIRINLIKMLGLFLPPGAPLNMAPLLVIIEMVGYFFRLISLPVRLFANMMSGNILLTILAGFAWTMMSNGGLLFLIHVIPLLVVFALMFLETGIACIDADVFKI